MVRNYYLFFNVSLGKRKIIRGIEKYVQAIEMLIFVWIPY